MQYDKNENGVLSCLTLFSEDNTIPEAEAAEATEASQTDENTVKAAEAEKASDGAEAPEIKSGERDTDFTDRRITAKMRADRLYSEWENEIKALEKIYPGFDIKGELKNKSFVSLLRKNIPIRDAFELTHRKEIFESIIRYAASSSEERIISRLNRFSSRENENGSGGHSTAVMKRDVSRLSKKDRADIISRVKNGETIIF